MNRIDIGALISHHEERTVVELGVARGEFSELILQTFPDATLISVDRWAGDRGHGNKEYLQAKKRLEQFGDRSKVVALSFHEAVATFDDDEFLDWIYIDGYAHTGQEDGRTLRDWYPKLKPGGIFSGHNYHSRWPLTIEQVDTFAKEQEVEVELTDEKPYPSWYWIKKEFVTNVSD